MTAVHDIYIKSKFVHFFIVKFTPDMVSGNELYMYMYRVNSFIFIIKFTPDMVSGNELYKYMHRGNSLMFMVKFTLNIVSRTELPAVY